MRLNQIKWLGPSFLEDYILAQGQWPSSFIYGLHRTYLNVSCVKMHVEERVIEYKSE